MASRTRWKNIEMKRRRAGKVGIVPQDVTPWLLRANL